MRIQHGFRLFETAKVHFKYNTIQYPACRGRMTVLSIGSTKAGLSNWCSAWSGVDYTFGRNPRQTRIDSLCRARCVSRWRGVTAQKRLRSQRSLDKDKWSPFYRRWIKTQYCPPPPKKKKILGRRHSNKPEISLTTTSTDENCRMPKTCPDVYHSEAVNLSSSGKTTTVPAAYWAVVTNSSFINTWRAVAWFDRLPFHELLI